MTNKKEVLAFIKTIRESFPDAAIIFNFGACYSLYIILKNIYVNAIPYTDKESDHIIIKIDNYYYDINGEYIDSFGKQRGDLILLTNQQKEYWASVVYGQRVEFMLKKYNQSTL